MIKITNFYGQTLNVYTPLTFLQYDTHRNIIGLLEDDQINELVDGVYGLKDKNRNIIDKWAIGIADQAFLDTEHSTDNTKPSKSPISVDMPNVTSIGTKSFFDCTKLTQVSFQNVKTIGQHSFNGCSELTTVHMSNLIELNQGGEFKSSGITQLTNDDFGSLTSISASAFEGCSKLISVDLQNVTGIGGASFKTTDALISVNLPNCKSVGNQAFNGCRKLTYVNLPKCEYVGNAVFYAMGRYVNSNLTINLPSITANKIAANAFQTIGYSKGGIRIDIDFSSIKVSELIAKYSSWQIPGSSYVKCLDDREGSETNGQLITEQISNLLT